jgi:hypothetical protein
MATALPVRRRVTLARGLLWGVLALASVAAGRAGETALSAAAGARFDIRTDVLRIEGLDPTRDGRLLGQVLEAAERTAMWVGSLQARVDELLAGAPHARTRVLRWTTSQQAAGESYPFTYTVGKEGPSIGRTDVRVGDAGSSIAVTLALHVECADGVETCWVFRLPGEGGRHVTWLPAGLDADADVGYLVRAHVKRLP